ncbi:hypothetical protein pb186bvf_013760 [Paramecium bursaria]
MSQQFIQENIDKFYEEIKSIDLSKDDAKVQMQRKLNQYDQLFQQKYNNPTPQQLAQTFKKSEVHVQVPPKGSELEKNLSTQFVADGSVFGQYQKMMRQAQVPVYVPPPPPPPKPETIISNAFMRTHNNYQNLNANTNYYSNNTTQQNTFNRPLIDNSQQLFLDQQRQLMMFKQEEHKEHIPQEQVFYDKIKQRINELGGIEDTVQVMKQSLFDYEQQIVPKGTIQGPVQVQSNLQPESFVNTQTFTQPEFHPFQNYIQTDQNLSILNLPLTVQQFLQ